MKPRFESMVLMKKRFVNRFSMTMTKSILFSGVLLLASLSKVQAVDPVFENFGTLTNVPQIDATTFINHGLFSVSSTLPYETQNTLHFNNYGTMTGNPGFRLDFATAGGGLRRPASDFFNGLDSQITAGSASIFLPGTILGGLAFASFENSQLIISATNITSKGQISADARGLVRLEGSKIDVSRSSVGIFPFNGGLGLTTETNFIPEIGVFDVYWGMNNEGNRTMPSQSVAAPIRNSTNFMVTAPNHRVTNQFSPRGFITSLLLTNAAAFTLTNAVTPTNIVVQAVFVQTRDAEMAFDVRFAPSTIQTNPYTTAVVQFSNIETNVLQGGNFLTEIYVLDRIASETNFLLLTNLVSLNTYRPSTYEVTRVPPFEFFAGRRGNATNPAALLFNPTYTNMTVTNVYAAYDFRITNVAGVVPAVAGTSLSNLPGRVEIKADELNMDRTRMRGEGIVNITAKKITSINSAIDSQNLNLNLGAPSEPLLVVKNLVQESLERTSGDILCWSAMWTNQTGMLVTNSIPDPNNPGGMTNEVITNVVEIGFHALVVDAKPVITRQPVFVANFAARSRQLDLSDTLRVTESLLIESGALNLKTNVVISTQPVVTTNAPIMTNMVLRTNITSGKIILTNTIPDWNRGTFPNLTNLVNDGQIYLLGSADLGTGRSRPYSVIINRGSITAFNAAFRTALFENRGTVQASAFGSGTITLDAGSAILERGAFNAGGPIRITAGDLRIRNYTNRTSQALTLVVTNSVTDGGVGASNIISSEGFHLLRKPRTGDLLATTFESIAPTFLEVPHTWAGLDRGPVAAGFKDNMALGRLVLRTGLDTLHSFHGIATNNALYVDILDIRGITNVADVEAVLQIDPNFTIYFADSGTNLPPAQLDGLLGGRLRWVSGFAGLLSSVDVNLNLANKTIQMNRALRESLSIDSDGDGIVNGLDANPRDDLDRREAMTLNTVAVINVPPAISFSWRAAPGTVYHIEYTTDLFSPDWKQLSSYTNTTSSAKTATIQDRVSPQTQRFYRVRTDQ
jgi:hypothetical protein